ncbi:MAG: hypothetical protein LUD81_03160 [Clostridiales bacterium]|nr:hypothetical protein [Clostridiales bacterium]
MAAPGRKNFDEQINRLREQREKKEKGLDYRVDNIFTEEKTQLQKNGTSKQEEEKAFSSDPYVKRVTLDELINQSRAAKGEKPVERSKRTPFLSREKEMKSPELDNKGMKTPQLDGRESRSR